jgi:hypothetical protein
MHSLLDKINPSVKEQDVHEYEKEGSVVGVIE